MHKLTVCWQPGLHRIRHSHGHFLLAVTRFGFKAAPSMLLITIKQCFRILANQIGIKIIIIISTIIDHHRSSQSSQPVNKCLKLLFVAPMTKLTHQLCKSSHKYGRAAHHIVHLLKKHLMTQTAPQTAVPQIPDH